MLKRNTSIWQITQFLHSLVFTIPIWIVYYQGKIELAEISYLVTIQYCAQMILEIPSGALADLIGRKNTNLIGWIIGSLSFLFFPLATSFWHFAFLAIMAGLFDSFRSGSEEALLYDSYKQENKEELFEKAYGVGNFVYQVGLITATALGGFLYERWVFLPFILYGISLAVGAVLICFYQEPKIDSQTVSLTNYLDQIKNGSKEVFKHEYAKYLSLFYIAVSGITWSGTLYFNEFMLVEFGFSDSARGVIAATMRLINVGILYAFLQNSKFFNEKKKIIFFPIALLVAFLPGVVLTGWWGVPFVQIAMIATTARWVLLAPMTNKVFSSKYRATAISFLSLMIGVVYVSLTTVSTVIIPQFGIQTMYSLLGIASLLLVVPTTIKLLQLSDQENQK